MIDIESELFDKLAKAIRKSFPKAFVTGEYVKTPSAFPCVFIIESDNQVLESTRTTDSVENHAILTYEVNVFSNKTRAKKTEAKKILSIVDVEMGRLGFTRTLVSPIPNMEDATIYRIVARYRAVVSQNNTIYRR